MFGEDSQIRQLKKDMQATGCDMNVVKEWQKTLDRMKKQYEPQCECYESARTSLEEVNALMKHMEQLMINRTNWSRENAKELSELRKELKRLKESYVHGFLVSEDDKEFHLTYETILKLSDRFDGGYDNKIILQSEIENILAMIREDIEKDKPNMLAMTCFYLVGSDKELVELSHKARLEKIKRVYELEFKRPMLRELERARLLSESELEQLIFRICTQ